MKAEKDVLQKVLDKFTEVVNDPLKTARSWKEGNGKVVGCAGLYVPEEIIHAAGILPIVILEKDAPIQKADAHVQNFMCGYIRSFMDQILLGDLKFLDALVIKDCCHVIRMIGDLARYIAKDKVKIEFMFCPVTIKKKESIQYLKEEFQSLIKRMEAIAGRSISEEDLANSIKVYNHHRQLLIKLYELRRHNPGLLSAIQVVNIVKASMLMPKEEHNALLEELIGALENRKNEVNCTKIPVIISGSLCEGCDTYVLEAIEEAGGVVVDDDLYVGSRYFNTLVNEELPPVDALTLAYANRVSPCPTQDDPTKRLGEYLTEMVKNSKAQGVINVVVKFCEAHYHAYRSVRNDLEKNTIREYMIYTDHDISAVGQVKTRIQSFIESLKS